MIRGRLTLYVLCGNAAYNRGDRGNLSAQIALLRERFPDANIVVDSFRADVDRGWYSAEVVQRGAFLGREQIERLASADVVIWGGGALVCDNAARTLIPYWLAVILFVKRVLRKPVMAWAQGLVVTTKLGARLGRLALNEVDTITVRDRNSFETLERIGATRPPRERTADPALLVKPASPERGRALLASIGFDPSRDRIFAITPTFWPFYHDASDIIPFFHSERWPRRRTHLDRSSDRVEAFVDVLARIATRLVDGHQGRVLLIPRYPTRPWRDLEFLGEVRKRSRRPDDVFVLEEDRASPEEYLAMFHSFACLVSTALHDAIFATAMQVPCVQFYYEPKGRDFFEELGAADRTCDWEMLFREGAEDQVSTMVRDTMESWETHKERMSPHRERLMASARRNADILEDLVRRRISVR